MRRARILTLIATDLFVCGLVFADSLTQVILAICCALIIWPIFTIIRDAAHEHGVQDGYAAAWEDVKGIIGGDSSVLPPEGSPPSVPVVNPQAAPVDRR